MIGPFHDAAGVARLLAVDESVVGERLASGDLLGCVMSDGTTGFPVFQFTDNQVNPALPAIHHLHNSPRWAAALWFVTPNDELDDHTPVDWAAAGRPADAITRAAGHRAHLGRVAPVGENRLPPSRHPHAVVR